MQTHPRVHMLERGGMFMKIIALTDQRNLEPLLADLYARGVREDGISLIHRQTVPATTETVTHVDGPLEGGVSTESLGAHMKHGGEEGVAEGAAIGAIGGAALGTALMVALGPVGLLGLLGFAAVGGGVGAVSGLGIGALGGALEAAGEETRTTEVLHHPAEAVGEAVVEGNLPEPTLTPEQQAEGRRIVEEGGALLHIDDQAFPGIDLVTLASQHGGYLL